MVRNTYRNHDGISAYWDNRWSSTGVDLGEMNTKTYPGKFAKSLLDNTSSLILEAGCGMGRNLLYGNNLKRQMIGIEYSNVAVRQLKKQNPDLYICRGDAQTLPFPDNTFGGVMAFGLYHNFEHGCLAALNETFRVMKPNALLVASFRVDNLANKLNDWIESRNLDNRKQLTFHKANYTKNELLKLFSASKFDIERIDYVENMPILYKFKMFRHKSHKQFDEQLGRSEGYKLSKPADLIYKLVSKFKPTSVCNVAVITARRPPQ